MTSDPVPKNMQEFFVAFGHMKGQLNAMDEHQKEFRQEVRDRMDTHDSNSRETHAWLAAEVGEVDEKLQNHMIDAADSKNSPEDTPPQGSGGEKTVSGSKWGTVAKIAGPILAVLAIAVLGYFGIPVVMT